MTRRPTPGRLRGLVSAAVFLLGAASALPAMAEVVDVEVTDVTTRALAVVWAADAIVMDAQVHVFDDAAGTSERTDLTHRLVSAEHPPALELGIVKVEVSGLSPGSCVYFQTETTSIAGTVFEPESPPFAEQVCLATEVTKESGAGLPIANDLISHPLLALDELTAAVGGLLVVWAPGTATYPVSAFIQSGFPSPLAVVNLNNLMDIATGASVEVPAGATLRMAEYRGLRCIDEFEHQRLIRFRKVPDPDATTELSDPVACFYADTDCNDAVDSADADRVFLEAFDSVATDCSFNRDLDVVSPQGELSDETIDVLDAQRVMNQVGEPIP